jgi:hypothetical protein
MSIQKIYNPLNKYVRRIKDKMAGFQISIAMMLIPLTFGCILWALNNPNSPIFNLLIILGIIFGIGGIALWGKAYSNAKKERDQQKAVYEKLNKTMDDLPTNIGKAIGQAILESKSNTSQKK